MVEWQGNSGLIKLPDRGKSSTIRLRATVCNIIWGSCLLNIPFLTIDFRYVRSVANYHLPFYADIPFSLPYPMLPAIITLDLEGVFTPEIWIEVAEKTGIPGLKRTTRDEPDYDKLMRYRLDILQQHQLSLPDIQKIIAQMTPLPGAYDFLNWLRRRLPVIILSDTFYEFAMPLMAQLDYPTLFCNSLQHDAQGMITGYTLRIADGKRAAVEALQKLNFFVIAAGDSYNDTTMLSAADQGILFRPPASVIADFPQFPVTWEYAEIQNHISALLSENEAVKGPLEGVEQLLNF